MKNDGVTWIKNETQKSFPFIVIKFLRIILVHKQFICNEKLSLSLFFWWLVFCTSRNIN